MPKEADLLSGWASRHRDALGRFFRRRVAQGHDQDLVQEVFVRLARRGELDNIKDIERYIFRTASNVLIDWRRGQQAQPVPLDEYVSGSIADDTPQPDRILIGKDSVQRLIDVVSTMPDRTQQVFSLYHFEHMSHKDIGYKLGIAVRTVEDHMARANAMLLKHGLW